MKRFNRLLLLLACIALVNMAWAQQSNCLSKVKPDSRYTDNGDGTVTDNVTDLTWMKCAWGQEKSDCSDYRERTETRWKRALKIAQQANQENYLGRSDWRLPNIKELYSLVDKGCYNPAINTDVFPVATFSAFGETHWATGIYWSSTPFVQYDDASTGKESNQVYIIDFEDGIVQRAVEAPNGSPPSKYKYLVRLVSNSPGGSGSNGPSSGGSGSNGSGQTGPSSGGSGSNGSGQTGPSVGGQP